MKRHTLGIVGTGAIGGSIGMRARSTGIHVIGYDTDRRQSERACKSGALDRSVSREDLYAEATTIVLSLHVEPALLELRELRKRPPSATLIIDVASVKVPIVEAARGLASFVATHPMAGTEKSGAAAARADLFENRTWVYVSSGDLILDQRACSFIQSLGAKPCAVDAQQHDRIVARTSHLPQLCATLVAGQLAGEPYSECCEALYGPAAKELLRLAQSSFTMWEAILRLNAVNVGREARLLAAQLNAVADDLVRDDREALRRVFERAGAA